MSAINVSVLSTLGQLNPLSFFSSSLEEFLLNHVITAGNVLAAVMALVIPLITRHFIIPYIYHPYRYGGIPFVPPSFMEAQFMYFMIITCVIFAMYLLSGFMDSLRLCDNFDYQIVVYNFKKVLLPLILCFITLTCFPIAKIPFLILPITIPYAEEVANGIFWCIATFIGVVLANMENTYQTCGQ
jgi:hypothetical protein